MPADRFREGRPVEGLRGEQMPAAFVVEIGVGGCVWEQVGKVPAIHVLPDSVVAKITGFASWALLVRELGDVD